MTFWTLDFLGWVALAGVLLLALALASAHVRRLPVSASAIYLVLGWVMGPGVLGWLRLDLVQAPTWFERMTEMAVVLALFIGGLKLRLPPRHAAWHVAYRLAGPLMLASIVSVALLSHWVLGISAPFALLLGAVLAPTDPVLAGAVSVNDAADNDRMRYGLSGEAGLNDGMAFPFVVLALEWMQHGTAGQWLLRWTLLEVVWAIPAALILGYGAGRGVGRLAIRVRSRQRDTEAPSDFFALAVIALTYATAETVGAWGFLAVFAAGVGLRRAEVTVVAQTPNPKLRAEEQRRAHPPAEHLVGARTEAHVIAEPAVAAGVLIGETISFGETAERIMEVLLVTVVGVSLGVYWDSRALLVALALFFVVRPVAARLILSGTETSPHQRWLMGWFGIRGIGSMYYLAYALNHGLPSDLAHEALALALPVVAGSILLHGISATPLLDHYSRRLRASAGRLP